MKVSKWVDMGQEVEVEIGVDDIRAALTEGFALITEDRLGEPMPTAYEVKKVLSNMAQFLKALTDEQIATIGEHARKIVAEFLRTSADRFMAVPE